MSDRRGAECVLHPVTLGLITGFNIHSFAQKIKYAHLETAGPVGAGFSSETRAHHLEQEEETKRESWPGVQGVQPGGGREKRHWGGQLSSSAGLPSPSHVVKSGEQRGSTLLFQPSIDSWRLFSFYSVESGGNVGKRTDWFLL